MLRARGKSLRMLEGRSLYVQAVFVLVRWPQRLGQSLVWAKVAC